MLRTNMALARWEGEQRRRGNINGADIARLLLSQYGDVSLPSPETPVLQPFTSAEKSALKKDGLIIYPFSLQTIKSQKDAGKPFWYVVNGGPQFETVSSMVGEVAFNLNPDKFYLKGSNYKTLDQQEELNREYERELRERRSLPDHIRSVIGQAPDYTQLAFKHLEETGERLFGQKYGYNYARTKTPTSDSRVAYVGGFDAAYGLHVLNLDRGEGRSDVFLVPLVVSVAS